MPQSEPLLSELSPRRVVFDTNLLVSLYIFRDSKFALLRQCIEQGRWVAFTRADCLEEFRLVLAFSSFKLDAAAQQSAFSAYQGVAKNFNDVPLRQFALPRCRDRADQKFLELARDAGVDDLITSDKDLLRLMRRRKMDGAFRIVTPAQVMLELSGS